MKCCIISTLYPPNIVGGAEKVTAKLASALVKAGHSVTVITLHDGHDTKIEFIDGVKVYYLPIDNLYWPFNAAIKPPAWKRVLWHMIDIWNFKAASRVGEILDAEKPDIVNCNNVTGFSVAVWNEAKKRGIKIVHTLHDYSLLCPRGTLTKNGNVCETRCGFCVTMSLPKYIASRMVDHVVGVSKYVAAKHTDFNYFPNAKQSVIHNICELPESREKLSRDEGTPFTFGFIGRVEQEKGIEVLLKAAVQLPQGDWRLCIAGRGRNEFVDALKIQYANANIKWLGFTKPDEFYPQIDALIVPSLWPEPLTGVIAEAGARDIPVIISEMGGMPEFLEMGVLGLAIPAGDVHRLATEMQDAMAGRGVMAMPQNNKKWQDELSETKIVEQYIACYQKYIASKTI